MLNDGLVVDYFKDKTKAWTRDKDPLAYLLDINQDLLVKEFRTDRKFADIRNFVNANKDKTFSSIDSESIAKMLKENVEEVDLKQVQAILEKLTYVLDALARKNKEKKRLPPPVIALVAAIGVATILSLRKND